MRTLFRKLRFLLSLWLLGSLATTAAAQDVAEPRFTLECRKGARVGGGKEQFCELRDLTMPVPVGQPLVIDGATYSTGVYGWDGPDVRIKVLVQSGGDTPAEAQARVRDVVVTAAGNRLQATRPDDGVECLIRFQVYVPRATALVITTGGTLRLDNLRGRIEFRGGSGNALLQGLGGQVTGSISSGNLTVVLADGQWAGEGLDVRTVNGDVYWQMPATYSARLELSTVNGSIYTALPVVRQGSRQVLATTAGQGGALLRAASINGNIYVRDENGNRTATRAARPADPAQGIENLKNRLAHARPEAYDTLLTQARQLGSVSAQVVLLSRLAGQQPQSTEAATQVQEAARLAGSLRDVSEAGWALGQVGRLQSQLARQSPELTGFYAPVQAALSDAMNASAAFKTPAPDIPASPERRRVGLGAVPGAPTVPLTLPGFLLGRLPRPGGTSRLLDTLLAGPAASPQVTRRQQVRRQQLDRSQALSTAAARQGDYARAYQYYVQYSAYKDSLTAEATTRRLAELRTRQRLLRQETRIQQLTRQEQQRRQEARRQQQFVVGLGVLVALLALFSFILSRSNRARRQANLQLSEQKDALQQALADLRTAQSQLIQSEKMASLGELTAGIAHEIQNPLNFVNNFADVSQELLTELLAAQATGDHAEAADLAADLGHNLGKIHEHGQRASGIVRGMLEHSRTSTGQRQPTDVNALCDEYLRLAYHGLRAKDKAFNATLNTDLTPNLPKVEAVPGDLGRVLLNLLTNAFYAVQKRQQQGEPGYQPTVQVRTRREPGRVCLQVRDNGAGIPAAIQPKIFQPFFTTKPTGEGTGLGLSLAYDIITNGHGGTLALDSKEGEYTEFSITLPI